MSRLLAILALVLVPLPVRAKTVDILFEPPQLDAEAVCDPRLGDETLTAKWAEADPAIPPETDTALIKRDFRRLLEMDPGRWFDVIAAVEANFQSIDPDYSDVNMLIDRIELLLAAGRVGDLQDERLVERLAAMDLTQTPRAQNLLAGYYMRGVGIPKDQAKGEGLLLGVAFFWRGSGWRSSSACCWGS